MRTRPRLFEAVLASAAAVALMHPAALTAQSNGGSRRPKFDITRMADSEGLFQTFHVSETQPLRQALDSGTLKEDTPVLVTQTASWKLALLTDQMSYHPIAQGEAAGKPWMVTF